MTKVFANSRDLWADSAAFRVAAGAALIGSCLLMISLVSSLTSSYKTAVTAQQALDRVETLADVDIDVTPEQDRMIHDAIDTMTTEQRRLGDQLLQIISDTASGL